MTSEPQYDPFDFNYSVFKAFQKEYVQILETVDIDSGYFSSHKVFHIQVFNQKLKPNTFEGQKKFEKHVIVRRYSDFEKFHQSIRENYREILMPSLPLKTYMSRLYKHETEQLKNRIEGLELYLNKILTNEQLHKCEEFQRFFSSVS